MNLFTKVKNQFIKIRRAIIFLEDPGKFHVRIKKLRKQGMKIGKDVKILHDTIFDASRPWLIEIGNNVTFAPRCHVLTHDASMDIFLKKTRIGKVKIFDNCFFGAGTIILPNITIGPNVIIGAGSVVTKNIPENSVYAGNPARLVSRLDKFLTKHQQLSNKHPSYPYPEYHVRCITADQAKRMSNELNNSFGYSIRKK